MIIPLIKTKFKIPRLPFNYISRDYLINKLSEGLAEDIKLTLLIANAGYGKSTLIVDYVEKSRKDYFWYSLNENDSDLIVFINHLIKGLKLAVPSLNNDALEVLVSATEPEDVLHNIMGLLLEDLSMQVTEEFIIVLDDYQFIRNSDTINQALEYFIEYLPENIQLIIISRSMPNIKKIPQLRVRQQLIEIQINDLKFKRDETEKIIHKELKDNFSEGEISRLYSQTNGWIGIIILLTQAVKVDAGLKKSILEAIEEKESVFEYIAYEVFEHQEKHIQDFMLRTSLLPKINREICRELSLQNINETLNLLKSANLFETFNENEYKYNPILKDFLQQKARESLKTEDLKNIFYKISVYFQKRQETENGLEYLFLSNNYKEAEDMLLDIAQDLINSNRLSSLEKFIKRFPENYLNKSSNLQIYLGEINRLLGNYPKAMEYFYQAEELAIRENNFSTLGRVYVYESIIHASKGEKEAEELINEALKIFPEDDSFGLAFAYNTKGITYLFSERIRESLNYFKKSPV